MKILIYICFLCCSFSNCNAQSTAKKSKTDADVAIQFINSYVDHCSQQSSTTDQWIEKNQLLTKNFKSAYKQLVDSANKADPDLGLDFDPIFDAQDYPDKGFELVSYNDETGVVTVRGKNWPDFILVMKIAHQANKYLVDGSGIINIPKNDRAKR
ncbi:hypothetical protein [uncultured Bacteroides sp.]|uniref:hypothetical protein n=1 Tax=uncultured Bacteroides sp. TaxID=162156 RepID=UPI002AABFE76|nr:hypothetical protein [uncultured Bacteroides sp.]